MPISENHLKISYTARYYLNGKADPGKPFWLVLHGYGQLAKFFVRKFQPLADAGHTVIAPEGLSKFYLDGFSGRVGATWMTKEDRLVDIQNYISYLSQLCQELVPDGARLYVLGFSQGAATASRFITQTSQEINAYIQWAGKFPVDVPLNLTRDKMSKMPIRLVYGNADEFVNVKDVEHEIAYLKQFSPDFKQISFEGGHIIEELALHKLLDSL